MTTKFPERKKPELLFIRHKRNPSALPDGILSPVQWRQWSYSTNDLLLVRASRGYWLFEYLPVSRIILKSRKNYGLAYLYTEYDENDLTYFLQYNISCIGAGTRWSAEIPGKQADRAECNKSYYQKDWGNQSATGRHYPGNDGAQRRILSIRKIMQMYDVVYQTARTDLLDLEKRKFLIRQQRGREFLFIFNENSELWKKSERKLSRLKNNLQLFRNRNLD